VNAKNVLLANPDVTSHPFLCMNGPNFICIGAQKAGTGWLYEQLRAHPDFWMPPIKELHYFDREMRTPRPGAEDRFDEALRLSRDPRDQRFIANARQIFADPEMSPQLYARLFEGRGTSISGDITPGYSTLPDETVTMITQSFPDTKILFLARDPVERAWSQVSMWVRHGRIPHFDSTDTETVLKVLSHPGILARSYPSRIVGRWRQRVSPERFHVYFFDDLRTGPEKVRHSILEVLGADPGKESGNLPAGHNTKARLEKLQLTDDARQEVANFFRQELEDCSRELGGPAAEWPGRYGFVSAAESGGG
jgi:hypothetical protein